jgi:hypothetical protein
MILVTVLPNPPNYSLHLQGPNGNAGPNSHYECLTKEALVEKLRTSLDFSADEIEQVFVSLEGPDRKYINRHQGELG